MEEILRFEGLKLGGSTMACKRKKRVYSKALGREVMRCAEFDKGGLGFGKFRIPGVNINQIKDTLITGGVAVGGAILTSKAVNYLAPMVGIDTGSKWMPVIEIGTGIALGVGIGKVMRKPDLGAAFAIGPVVINGLRLASGIISTDVTLGNVPRLPLGVVQEQAAFPPGYMYDKSYSDAAQQQYTSWAM